MAEHSLEIALAVGVLSPLFSFWALVFLYMWVGAHHLHWTALPDWTSTLAATFSILLLLPSWGGMINGIMTLSGAWDKLRSDPVIRFLIVALSFFLINFLANPQGYLRTLPRKSENPMPIPHRTTKNAKQIRMLSRKRG